MQPIRIIIEGNPITGEIKLSGHEQIPMLQFLALLNNITLAQILGTIERKEDKKILTASRL